MQANLYLALVLFLLSEYLLLVLLLNQLKQMQPSALLQKKRKVLCTISTHRKTLSIKIFYICLSLGFSSSHCRQVET